MSSHSFLRCPGSGEEFRACFLELLLYGSRTSISRVLIPCVYTKLCGGVNNEPEGTLEMLKHSISVESHTGHMLGRGDYSPYVEFRVNLPEGLVLLLCT